MELAVQTGETADVVDALETVDRLNGLREHLVTMLQTKEIVSEIEAIDLGELAEPAWKAVNSPSGSVLEVVETARMEGYPAATRRLLQNLLSNSVEHAKGSTTIHIGEIAN